MGWRDQLPAIRAENEAWREKHVPALRERQQRLNAEREEAAKALVAGLDAINADDRLRKLAFHHFGVPA